ncbi:GNAT family N-acetyltransferase [Pararhizobium antarcticum]|uniref:Acetyltransferase n=1 Tax=Pararhizobium antarcticum TaxID=1798805 RepID=A0A657LTH4_9HYPH|nr:GNAT family N-acetyltransferase [Pararhizobium antarcticum]OJF96834.1 acetyltransferase [Pararhizobium antarcticum]OJF99008.1 acetyltransferase [Rhizobium sp. 58]
MVPRGAVTESACTISDLNDRPDFCATVADRIWLAWWKEKGTARHEIETRVRENLNPDGFPFAVIAHDGDDFHGTASVIASDLDERPDYTPWIAAVWVDPQHRGKGTGGAIVRHAARIALARGFETIYLCALPEKSDFYLNLGWSLLEEDVGEHKLCVLTVTATP